MCPNVGEGSPLSTSDYFIKTEQFEGPLDLLLHLVKVNEIDIFDIDILRLTEEYLNYLRKMKFDDLQQAGDFLEMAATLIEIKTRMLLPHEIKQTHEDLDEDPIRSLQDRLLEYETFRSAAGFFQQMPQMGVDIQTSREWLRLDPLYEDVESPLEGDSATLIVMYEQMLAELGDRRRSRVVRHLHQVTVEEIIDRLEKEILNARFALFQGFYNRMQGRYELVAYLLAMLELTKDKRVHLYQQDLCGPLWLYSPDCNESELPIPARPASDFSCAPSGEVS